MIDSRASRVEGYRDDDLAYRIEAFDECSFNITIEALVDAACWQEIAESIQGNLVRMTMNFNKLEEFNAIEEFNIER